jgi:hypothetical protein
MQSPYNSKSMKNKFNSTKNKKGFNQQVAVLSQCASIDQLQTCGGDSNNGGLCGMDMTDNEHCKRCNELLNLLKQTRFMAR